MSEPVKSQSSFKLISGIIILSLLVIFTVQNIGSTEITILIWSGQAPLVVLLLIFFILGALLFFIPYFFSGRNEKKLRKQIETLQKEIKDLKSFNRQNPSA